MGKPPQVVVVVASTPGSEGHLVPHTCLSQRETSCFAIGLSHLGLTRYSVDCDEIELRFPEHK